MDNENKISIHLTCSRFIESARYICTAVTYRPSKFGNLSSFSSLLARIACTRNIKNLTMAGGFVSSSHQNASFVLLLESLRQIKNYVPNKKEDKIFSKNEKYILYIVRGKTR